VFQSSRIPATVPKARRIPIPNRDFDKVGDEGRDKVLDLPTDKPRQNCAHFGFNFGRTKRSPKFGEALVLSGATSALWLTIRVSFDLRPSDFPRPSDFAPRLFSLHPG
jgi:hypothetical protein